jgi:hypothetical protein
MVRAATRSGSVLSRIRALGLQPRAAGGPVHSPEKAQKISKNFQKFPKSSARASKKLQKVTISLPKFDHEIETYQRLTGESAG